MNGRAPATPARLARLDGMRGIAACGVALFYHVRALFPEGTLDTGNRLLDWPHMYAWLFVDLFFVLSGYVFAHVYLGRATLRSEADLKDFAIARFARLYPLHLVMLCVSAAAFWGVKPENTPLAFVGHLFMLQAAVEPVANTFIGPSWSLSVEVACYVLFALAAVSGARMLRLVTGAGIAFGFVMLLANASPQGPWAADCFPRGFLGFFIGQALWHARGALARVPSWALAGVMALGAAAPPNGPWGAILPFALLVFPAATVLGLRLRLLESWPLVWLGERSFALYLIHIVPLGLILNTYGQLGSSAGAVIGGHLGFAVLNLALADLAYRHLEIPARRAIRIAWQRRQMRPAAA